MIVVFATNPLEPETWEECQTDDLGALLRHKFPLWPAMARIYDLDGIGRPERLAGLLDGSALAARDLTPPDPAASPTSFSAAVTALERAQGPLLVAIPPADPLTAAITVAVTLLAVAVGLFLIPKPAALNNTPSNNKSLSDRSNKARPNARIPDIFGTVRSVPDLLSVPYRRFENNVELELAYMCVGRGAYDLADVRDGDTLLASVAGAAAAFYGPNTSPNSGDSPQLQIGDAIADKVLSVVALGSVNGQLLKPSNANNARGDDNIRFVYPDQIQTNDSSLDFTKLFSSGDDLTVSGANYGASGSAGTTTVQVSARFEDGGLIRFETFDPTTVFSAGQYLTISNAGYVDDQTAGSIYVDLSGTYSIGAVDDHTITLSDPEDINTDWSRLADLTNARTGYRSSIFSVPTATNSLDLAGTYPVLSVTSNAITLSNPATVNAAWNNLSGLDGQATGYGDASLSTSSSGWIGPFVVDLDGLDQVLSNFVGLGGLYAINKKGKQSAAKVDVAVELTPVDANDDPIGPPELFTATLTGSKDNKDQVGLTVLAQPTFTGRCRVRARRTSATDLNYEGTLVDDVKWRDAYGMAEVQMADFGNVTTVLAKTYATSGATSVKERKLNLRARRRLPQRVSGSTFTTTLSGTDDLADIAAAVCLDPYIGGRSVDEVDFDSLYDTSAAIASYFGSDLARQFGDTFDDDNTSFEETLATIAQACFCQGYRQGRQIKLSFERATEDSVLMFNHRNVLPDSQTRTPRFGVLDDQDGVELDYTVPKDGAKLSVMLPPYTTLNSPRTVELSGVATDRLAYWQAWRAWNRMRYQNVAVELEATEEAALVIPNERVLIADMTRPDYLSGDVKGQDGTTLTLSDPVNLDPEQDYTIFLQLSDATVQALAASAWLDGAGQASDPRKLVLGSMPRLPLVMEAEAAVQTLFTVVPAADVQARAFLVSEREPNTDFTEVVRAVNYSFLYYQNDQLLLWLAMFVPDARDESAWGVGTAVTGGSFVVDSDRAKPVYQGAGGGSYIALSVFPAKASYTKAAWVKSGLGGGILQNGNELLAIGGGQLIHGHGPTTITAPLDGVGWHHVAATFDNGTGAAQLVIDGALASAGTLPARTLDTLQACTDQQGRVDDLRYYPRALSVAELREVYLAGKA
jgi:hypothetical protein